MDMPSPGESVTLIVRLHESAAGWLVTVDSGGRGDHIPLMPTTLLIHLWQPSDASVLRGTVQLLGSQQTAVFQSSAQLVTVVQHWLAQRDEVR